MYADWTHSIKHLSDEQAGKVLKHLLAYVNDEDPQTDDPIVNITFEPIKQQLKRDLEKWGKIRQKRSDAGKKSAEKRAQQKATNSTSVESVQQSSTNSTVNVNDNVNVNVTVNDNDNDNVIKEKKVYSKEIHSTLSECLKYFPIHLHPKKEDTWLDTIDKLHRIDKLPLNNIIEVVKNTRADSFWSKNFLSLTKLRKTKDGIKYIIIFNEQTKNNGTSKKGNEQLTYEQWKNQPSGKSIADQYNEWKGQ